MESRIIQNNFQPSKNIFKDIDLSLWVLLISNLMVGFFAINENWRLPSLILLSLYFLF